MTDERIPVSVLTGFLGSGKTTLLNSWLTDPALADAAVIVNEFGEIGIDHALIATSNENTIELSTGCLCCTVRGDLVTTLEELIEKRFQGVVRPFDRVIIETTGLADPAPVLQALLNLPTSNDYRLNRVVTVVDGMQGMATLDRQPEAVKQAVVADQIIVTKTDLDPKNLAELRERLGRLNPGAPMAFAKPEERPSPSVLDGADIYDPATKSEDVAAWLAAESFEKHDDHHHDHGHHHGHHHHHPAHDVNRHDASISSFCLTFDEPLHWQHVAAWLETLVENYGEDLLRVKGILSIEGWENPIVVQAVQTIFHQPAKLRQWPGNDRRSRIVFITRNISRGFVAELLAEIQTQIPKELFDRENKQ